MKVITLDEFKFEEACKSLARMSNIWKPDCLLGIRTGGYVVAKKMQPHYDKSVIPVFAVTKQRSSTKAKQASALIPFILKTLPYWITNRLRVLEHNKLTRKEITGFAASAWVPDADEWEILKTGLTRLTPSRILIVDDAIDTGVTMSAVEKAIKALCPYAEVRTAVIVQSTANPLVRPNDVLFSQQLCRFPWSHDFKKAARPLV